MRLLFLADVFGAPGRRAVEARLPELKHELGADLCIVNGENAADGLGLTAKLAQKLLAAGADVLTTGNHVWRHRDLAPVLEADARVLRPANLGGPSAPGHGLAVVETKEGTPVAVLNLQGIVFMKTPVDPFRVVDELVEEARAAARVVVVDFHAEATSEKVAMARHLDGRVTAVVGTHTHVQTNDARIQPGGTAAITDAGMTGPHDSVIGARAEEVLRGFITGLPGRLHPAEGDVRIEGLVVDCDDEGRATGCEPLRLSVP